MTRILCTLRTIEAGHEVTRLVTIEPIGDGTGEWRIVPDDRRLRAYQRYYDKQRMKRQLRMQTDEAR